MNIIELMKVVVLGIVEGITEWLPISSTGHMILVDEFLQLQVSQDFKNLFLVVIQLGAIMAVVVLYWRKLNPFTKRDGKVLLDRSTMDMWFKILLASVPAGIVGVLFDDFLETYLMNYVVVAIMLIIFGVLFIVVENMNANKNPKITKLSEITYQTALLIGFFQLIAAVFPGTSRSGATIVGALMIGVSRYVAAEFTFFLAIPAMFGASLLKLVKLGRLFSLMEVGALFLGMAVAFVVSILAIKFLMSYIKKNDFKVFGWYRIALGVLVLCYFFFV